MVSSFPARASWGLATLTVCALLACCDSTDAQTTLRTLQVGGQTRSYWLHVPPGYTGEVPVPLVLVLHGYLGSGRGIENLSGFSAKADQEGFLAIYPNALNVLSAWNYGWGPSNGNPQLDLDFFDLLLDALEGEFAVDPDRIFVAGLSDGGGMAHFLGAALSHRIAAIAAVGAAVGAYKNGVWIEAPPPERPVSALVIHGVRDLLIPYGGGGGASLYYLPAAYSAAFWVYANGCDVKPTTEISPDGRIITDTYSDGGESTKVQFCTVVDGGHAWFRRPDFNATDIIWEFFAMNRR